MIPSVDIYAFNSSKSLSKTIKALISETFQIPLHMIPRVLFHGLILSFIIAGFWLLDSLKDPILAGTVGIQYQPIAKLLSVVSTLFVVCIYDFLTSVVNKSALFHIISATFSVLMMILSALLADVNNGFNTGTIGPHRYLGWICYVSIEAYGSLMVALFWSFTNSIMNLEEAKGAYGLILSIAQIGAVLGSTLATNASIISIPNLFIIGAMFISSVSLLVKIYYIIYKDKTSQALMSKVRSISESSVTIEPFLPSVHQEFQQTTSSNKPPSDSSSYSFLQKVGKVLSGFYEGLSLILQNSYALKLLVVSCIYDIVVTIIDYEFKIMGSLESAGLRTSDPNGVKHITANTSDRFANLLGHFGQFTNLISFLLSFFGYSFLVHHLGVKYSLMIFPITLLIAIIASYLAPSLWLLFFFVSLLKGMIFSLQDPVKELLYIPTSESIKFKAKAWIDVFGSRLAKALGSTITSLSFGNIHKLQQISEIPALLLTLFLLLVTWSIGNDFQSLVENNQIVGDDGIPHYHENVSDLNGPIINGLRPGDVGYQGYDLNLFEGVFEDENNDESKSIELYEFKNLHKSYHSPSFPNRKQVPYA